MRYLFKVWKTGPQFGEVPSYIHKKFLNLKKVSFPLTLLKQILALENDYCCFVDLHSSSKIVKPLLKRLRQLLFITNINICIFQANPIAPFISCLIGLI